MSLKAPFFEQETRRQNSLITPVTLDTVIGATETTIYTGKADQAFLIRALAVVDDTVGAITLTVNVDGNEWFTDSIAANTIVRLTDIEGILIAPSVDITATGQNLRIVGWGLRIQGSGEWVL